MKRELNILKEVVAIQDEIIKKDDIIIRKYEKRLRV